jgi:DNA-binding transcriptional ArsR family regulator
LHIVGEVQGDDGDLVFRALADRGRRHLLDQLHAHNGQTLAQLCEGMADRFSMTRQAVSKHLAVLEEARLVLTLRRGREKRHFLNPGPIADLAGRWIGKYQGERVRALAELKRELEANHDG